MRRILVSGSGGFIGRALLSRLRGRGAEVVSIGTRLAHRPDHICVAGRWTASDWNDALAKFEPDAVYHLAGAMRGDEAYLREVNVEIAVNLFSALRTRKSPSLRAVRASAVPRQ